MNLRLLLENLLLATENGNLSDAEAFDQLRKFLQEEQVRLPPIAANESDRIELEKFITLAQKISAKYSI